MSCREMHPAWEYKLWTDDENRDLVEKDYPWLLETYDAFPENIMRADTARVLYMHKHGGVLLTRKNTSLRPENWTLWLKAAPIVEPCCLLDTAVTIHFPFAWTSLSILS